MKKKVVIKIIFFYIKIYLITIISSFSQEKQNNSFILNKTKINKKNKFFQKRNKNRNKNISQKKSIESMSLQFLITLNLILYTAAILIIIFHKIINYLKSNNNQSNFKKKPISIKNIKPSLLNKNLNIDNTVNPITTNKNNNKFLDSLTFKKDNNLLESQNLNSSPTETSLSFILSSSNNILDNSSNINNSHDINNTDSLSDNQHICYNLNSSPTETSLSFILSSSNNILDNIISSNINNSHDINNTDSLSQHICYNLNSSPTETSLSLTLSSSNNILDNITSSNINNSHDINNTDSLGYNQHICYNLNSSQTETSLSLALLSNNILDTCSVESIKADFEKLKINKIHGLQNGNSSLK